MGWGVGSGAPRSSAAGLPGSDGTAFIADVVFIKRTGSDFTPSNLTSSDVS